MSDAQPLGSCATPDSESRAVESGPGTNSKGLLASSHGCNTLHCNASNGRSDYSIVWWPRTCGRSMRMLTLCRTDLRGLRI